MTLSKLNNEKYCHENTDTGVDNTFQHHIVISMDSSSWVLLISLLCQMLRRCQTIFITFKLSVLHTVYKSYYMNR